MTGSSISGAFGRRAQCGAGEELENLSDTVARRALTSGPRARAALPAPANRSRRRHFSDRGHVIRMTRVADLS